MYKRKRVTAVILAGGNGSRMGISENKVYLTLGKRPAILYALETFDQHPYVDELVFVTKKEEWKSAEALLRAENLKKPWRLVLGGDSRKASVRNAIATVHNEIVLVHDGARPLVQGDSIKACVEALDRYDGAVVAIPMEEEVYRVSKKQEAPKRLTQTRYAAQTPQGFYTKTLRECHLRHRENANITDDSCLLELEGYKVGIVQGELCNVKLTTPMDLSIATAYLSKLNNTEIEETLEYLNVLNF